MSKFWKDLPNFESHEFDSPDKPGSGKAGMDETFMRRLQMLRNLYRKPLHVTSGFRTAAYNQQIGGAASSMHLAGKAADIAISGTAAFELVGLALAVGFKGGGVQQKGSHASRFIRLDLRDVPMIWSY